MVSAAKAARIIHILSDRDNRDPRFVASVMAKLHTVKKVW